MKQSSILTLVVTGAAAVSVGCGPSSSSTAPLTATPAPAVGAAGTTPGSGTYQGPAVLMRFGPVQATVTIRARKITKVAIAAPEDNPRSAFINQQAVPILTQETLQAQSANIDLISGATLTSEAFAQSLQAALSQAHIK